MPRHNVGYIKPDEPDFIKKMKEQIGWKEGPSVETKRETLAQATDEDFEDREDDLPTIVVLKKGDLTEEEAKVEMDKQKKEQDEIPAGEGGKILFKKPTKRENEATSSKDDPSNKKNKKDSRPDRHSKDGKKGEKIKNKKLLSFDDEEEEET